MPKLSVLLKAIYMVFSCLRNLKHLPDATLNLSYTIVIFKIFYIFSLQHLEFHGVMRFYYQSADLGSGQKVATKCIRVASTATTREIIETLIEKFRPDMKMLEVPEYALYEIHESGERKLGSEEKPLLVQLNWHKDDREGRFLLRRMDEPTTSQITNPGRYVIK